MKLAYALLGCAALAGSAAACAEPPARPAQAPTAAPTPAPTAPAVPAAAPAPAPAASTTPPPLPTEGGVVRMPGSRISLWIPQGMQRPTRVPFFKLNEPLLIVSFGEFTRDAGSTDEFLAGARDGAHITESQPIERGKARGFLGHGVSADTGLKRQVLALTVGGAVGIVTAQYADAAEPLANKIMDSVALDPDAALDSAAESGIHLGDTAGFQVSPSASPPLLLTDPGAKPTLNGAPSLTFMSLPYPKPDLSNEELGQMLGGSLRHYAPNMEQAKEEETKIGACPAYYFSAPGADRGRQLLVFGLIARCPDSMLIGIGTVNAADGRKTLPRFQKVIKGLKLDDSIFSSGAAAPQPNSQKLP